MREGISFRCAIALAVRKVFKNCRDRANVNRQPNPGRQHAAVRKGNLGVRNVPDRHRPSLMRLHFCTSKHRMCSIRYQDSSSLPLDPSVTELVWIRQLVRSDPMKVRDLLRPMVLSLLFCAPLCDPSSPQGRKPNCPLASEFWREIDQVFRVHGNIHRNATHEFPDASRTVRRLPKSCFCKNFRFVLVIRNQFQNRRFVLIAAFALGRFLFMR